MKREEYISDEAVVKRANEAVRIELEKKGRWIFLLLYTIVKRRLYIKNIVTDPE